MNCKIMEMNKSRFYLFLFLILASCSRHYLLQCSTEISAPKAYKLLLKNDNVIFVDVRTKEEFEKGHIKGAINIDYFSPQLENLLMTLPKEKIIIVYCKHALRSKNVVNLLKRNDYQKVYNLKGGFPSWTSGGFPVEK